MTPSATRGTARVEVSRIGVSISPSSSTCVEPDNGGAHHAKKLRWRARVVPLFLPAYCPEFNPIERWWRELKDAVANTLFASLDALRAHLDAELAAWTQVPARLASTPTCSVPSKCSIIRERWYYTRFQVG